MQRRTRFRYAVWTILLAGGIGLGYLAINAPDALDTAAAQAPEQVEALVVAENAPATPVTMLDRLKGDLSIINVHEHIQSTRELPTLLASMDRNGIGKTVLVGSSWFTITLNPRIGFTRYDWNNEQLIEAVELHPDRFAAWPTIDPRDPDKVKKIQDLVARGATGVKMYLGHGYVIPYNREYMFHTIAMDSPEMFPFYEWCEDNFIPLCFHVNPGPTKPGFAQEFIAVLQNFPDLKIISPHFILSSIRDSRLREFLLTFPNLYSDISFGHDDFLTAGIRRISRDPEKFREIFSEFPDRFMFGTDLVMTEASSKNVEWFTARCQTYYDMLAKETYTTPLVPGITLNGLALSPELLENILVKNFENFMALRLQGTKITRELNRAALGIRWIDRAPGQSYPPPER
jgi:predicted TIM-barrel fold metal-dependent hydrolase